mgnify:CR=1 FL=1
MEIKKIILVLFWILLSSCSSNQSIFENVNRIKSITIYSEKKPLKSFTREMLNHINYPLIEIKTEGILKQALMLPLSTRDGYVNYTSGSGQIITMKGAVVIRTNGMNNHLLSMETNENSPLIQKTPVDKWPLSGKREFKFLNSLNQQTIISFDCRFETGHKENIEIVEYKYNLTLVREKCKNNNKQIINMFWVGKHGFIWKSFPWIGEGNYAEISIIKPAI